MGQLNATILADLKNALFRVGIEEVIIETSVAPNISDPVLLIINYAPTDDKPPVCFALSLANYPKFPQKFWSSIKDIKVDYRPPNIKAGGKLPDHRPAYKEFCDRGRRYHPFSVDLSDYSCEAQSIKILLGRLYAHLNFG